MLRILDITAPDINNGNGVRVTLWVAGCNHHCKGCHNPITWDPKCGLEFDESARNEIFTELDKDYVSGITFSGGDPLHPNNRFDVFMAAAYLKSKYPNKTIWLYTGYSWEDICDLTGLVYIDVLVDKQSIFAGPSCQRSFDGSRICL